MFLTLCNECLVVYKNKKTPVKLEQKSKVFLLDWLIKARSQRHVKQLYQREREEQLQQLDMNG